MFPELQKLRIFVIDSFRVSTDYAVTKDLTDKIFLITGANSGIGLSLTQILLECGASVIMACRNPLKAKDAKLQLVQVLFVILLLFVNFCY